MNFLARDIGIATLVSLLFYSSGVLVIFTPLPLLYVFVAKGRVWALVSSFAAIAVIASLYLYILPNMLTGTIGDKFALPIPWAGMRAFLTPGFLSLLGVGYFVFFAAIAFALGEGATRKWSLSRWGVTALVTGLCVIVLMAVAANFFEVSAVLSGFKTYVSGMVKEIISLNQSGSTSSADVSFMTSHAEDIATYMLGVAPSIIFVFVLVAVVVNLVVGRRLIHKHHAFAHVHNVARFKLPDYVIWLLVVCSLGFFANRFFLNAEWLKLLTLNGLIVSGALYFFQGLAVVVYYMQGIKLPFLRLMAYLVIAFFFQTVALAVVAIGVADVWVDFRLRSWKAKHKT